MTVFAVEPMLRDAALAAAHELGLDAGAELVETPRLLALRHVLRALGPSATVPSVPRAGWGLLEIGRAHV